MTFFSGSYFCAECKKTSETFEDFLFVESEGQAGFCSEECIEKYYAPWVSHFEGQEKKWRIEHGLGEEPILDVVGQPSFMDQLMRRPSEVYCKVLEGGEHLYSFIKEITDKTHGRFHLMCLCLTYDYAPSFILCASATQDERLLKAYRWGKKREDLARFQREAAEGEGETLSLDENILQDVERKKSISLAFLLEERKEADIPIESFPLYENYFEETMTGPDEIYARQDDEGDTLYTYIKACDREGVSFYYFIVCLRIQEGIEKNKDALIPIISFPSLDGETYRIYRQGNLVSGIVRS